MNVVTFFYQQTLADPIWLFNTLLNPKTQMPPLPTKKKTERYCVCFWSKLNVYQKITID